MTKRKEIGIKLTYSSLFQSFPNGRCVLGKDTIRTSISAFAVNLSISTHYTCRSGHVLDDSKKCNDIIFVVCQTVGSGTKITLALRFQKIIAIRFVTLICPDITPPQNCVAVDLDECTPQKFHYAPAQENSCNRQQLQDFCNFKFNTFCKVL